MAVPSPNILLALFIVSFSLSAIFHRTTTSSRRDPSHPSPPSVFSRYSADILIPSTNDTFTSRPAAFGPDFDKLIEGELVKAWGDGLACSNSTEKGYEGKIILVERGRCAFVDKVRRVQEIGGKACIVGDNVPSSGLLTMYANGTLTTLSFSKLQAIHQTLPFYRHLFLMHLTYPFLTSSPSLLHPQV